MMDMYALLMGGSGGGGGSSDTVVLHVNPNTGALDKTWQEIYDALAAGKMVVYIDETDEPDDAYKGVAFHICGEAYTDYDGSYFCTFSAFFEGAFEPYRRATDSPNGYPE